jgi:hypothetical protein
MIPPDDADLPAPGETPETGLLLTFVADRDEPCPVCSYSLRGLTGPICPECGAPLRLRVGSPQLRVGAWALGIVSFALALGFDGVVAILLTAALIANPSTQWQPVGLVTGFVVLSGAMLGCLLWLVRGRPAWHRRPTGAQWRRASAIFLGVGLLHALFGLLLVLALNS